jgi:KaiC/GvpD/RAD55 family RecA-like ATPase
MSETLIKEALLAHDSQVRTFFHIIWTIEAFNSFAAGRLFSLDAETRAGNDLRPMRPSSFSVAPFSVNGLLSEFLNSNLPHNRRFARAVAFAPLEEGSSEASLDFSLVTEVVRSIQRLPGPQKLPSPLDLRGRVYLNLTENSAPGLYSSTPLSGSDSGRRMSLTFVDQVLNPLEIALGLAAQSVGGSRAELRADMLLQRFVREFFGIHYTSALKYSLARVLPEVDALFFGEEETESRRSATLDSLLVVGRLHERLYERLKRYGGFDEGTQALATGIVLALRWCKVFRVRYYKSNDSNESEVSASPKGQCLSALRRIEYGYFLNRLFGSLSDLPGLNFIFRGGILPRTSSGRVMILVGSPGSGKTVFALQKACSIAARGGLAVYFSIEERSELLVNRMAVFGLVSEPGFEFDVASSQEEFDEFVRAAIPGRGLLYLFGGHGEENFSLLDNIADLAKMKKWRWRCLVVDSVNALDMVDTAAPGARLRPSNDRLAARQLVDAIEEAKFLGLILSEDSPDRMGDLEYTADTVLRLRSDSSRRMRWLEISKCRSQNHHRGFHQFRLVEGLGVEITPSLGAIRSALRRRTKGDLSETGRISFPEWVRGVRSVREKSSVIFVGGLDTVRSELLIALASTTTRMVTRGRVGFQKKSAGSVLVVSFRVNEVRYRGLLRSNLRARNAWNQLGEVCVRWFSPGETITADQVIWEIWNRIKLARRVGSPIERIIFEGVENVSVALPTVAGEPLFWVTLFELLAAEAVTSFWSYDLAFDSRLVQQSEVSLLSSAADYVFSVGQESEESALSGEGSERVVSLEVRKGPTDDLVAVAEGSPPSS